MDKNIDKRGSFGVSFTLAHADWDHSICLLCVWHLPPNTSVSFSLFSPKRDAETLLQCVGPHVTDIADHLYVVW